MFQHVLKVIRFLEEVILCPILTDVLLGLIRFLNKLAAAISV